ncbi:hypothetical protein L596_029166 [Steinernema carpocapsae]|uniref:7TM GPCR serpentine receptor class x (Srx) domain-containing protein n=1 Tax=Steinernema carpocapsae TaxID=34508 RepID=A0A4U5LTV2_STECR|nr:hypothetical protein L596_029166 [Steinernema carpocapsae]
MYSDRAPCVSVRLRLILFNAFCQISIAVCFLLLAVSPADIALLGYIAYAAAITVNGLNVVGIFKCAHIYARQHIPFVMTGFAIINSAYVLLWPPIVPFMAPQNDPADWATIFSAVSGLVIVTNVFLTFACKTDAAPWTIEALKPNVIVMKHPPVPIRF